MAAGGVQLRCVGGGVELPQGLREHVEVTGSRMLLAEVFELQRMRLRG